MAKDIKAMLCPADLNHKTRETITIVGPGKSHSLFFDGLNADERRTKHGKK